MLNGPQITFPHIAYPVWERESMCMQICYTHYMHALYPSQYMNTSEKNLTDLKEITPVSVILTNNRCTKQVNNKGISYKNMNKAHTVCSIYDDTFDKSTALDFIFSLTLKYIMDCLQAHMIATPKDALVTVLGELRAYIKTRPGQLISTYLKRNIQILKIGTDINTNTHELNPHANIFIPNINPFQFTKPYSPSHPRSYQNLKFKQNYALGME